MRVKRILTDAETDAICRAHGVEPMERQGGPIGLEKLGLKAGDTLADDGTPAGGQNVRFSMEGPVEETKDLLAVHNLTEQNLEWALEMSGLPTALFCSAAHLTPAGKGVYHRRKTIKNNGGRMEHGAEKGRTPDVGRQTDH